MYDTKHAEISAAVEYDGDNQAVPVMYEDDLQVLAQVDDCDCVNAWWLRRRCGQGS